MAAAIPSPLVAANSAYCAGSMPTRDPAREWNCAYGIAHCFLAVNLPLFCQWAVDTQKLSSSVLTSVLCQQARSDSC